jgi:predicted phosphodiesterase
MKLRILSDLHLEFADWTPPPVSADVVVLAGDIHVGVAGIPWARHHFPDAAVVYVPGNHEFYGSDMDAMLGQLRRAAHEHTVHLLDADETVIDGVRFLGATLWTDFGFDSREPQQIARAMALAQQGMVDYRVIRIRETELLSPDDTRSIHHRQAAWLAHRLATPFDGTTVVVTHHLPHRRSVHPKFEGDDLNPSFVTHLPQLVREPVSLWIHGHTHESLNYTIGATRVVCNPRGYLPHEPNSQFDPELVASIS